MDEITSDWFQQVRNGSTGSSPLLNKYCGSLLPSPVFSQSNELYLRFKTDTSVTLPGYDIIWTSSPSGKILTVREAAGG